MEKATIRDIDVKNKKVFLRVDYNVPMKEGKIRDDSRIVASLPTIKYLIFEGAKIILASHLGRPKGFDENLSLKPVAIHLSKLLEREVKFLPDCIGDLVEKAVNEMKPQDVVLLENLRFHKEEEKNEIDFSKKLANLADIYVNDAFGAAHRAHSSTYGIAEFLPAVSGFLMEKELKFLGKLLTSFERPFVAILGGSKVADKVGVLKNLLQRVDALLVGGGMAFTFLKVKGKSIGKSLFDEKEDEARQILKIAEERQIPLLLPLDVVVAEEAKEGVNKRVVQIDEIPPDLKGLDIGPATIDLFKTHLIKAKTVFWNGPMGVFEVSDFAKGTLEIAKILAALDAMVCVGGGDSVAAVTLLGFSDKMTHLSTGGGASLEFLEKGTLPGIEVLMDKEKINARS